jgi:catechol 2,3-dioxygenase-like lactoylglutathione lyase family enzyme
MNTLPGLRGLDHYAITVPDVDEATAFLVKEFNAQFLYKQTPVEDRTGDFMARQLGVHPRASCDVVLLRLGPTSNVELFEYRAHSQRRSWPHAGEAGAHGWGLTTPASHRLDVPWGMPAGRVVTSDGPVDITRAFYTVPDLSAAVTFFTGPLGGLLVSWQDGAAVIALGPVSEVELRAATVPGARIPANSDIGGHHLALYTTDLPAAVAALHLVPGVEVLGEPQCIDEGGPIDGTRWIYFRAPWGLQLELVNLPPHLPYEQNTAARRYVP